MDYIQSNGNKTEAIHRAYDKLEPGDRQDLDAVARMTVKRVSARNFGINAAIEFLGAFGMLLVEMWGDE